MAAAAWVVALAVVVAHLVDVLLLAELFHLVVADAEASAADHSVVVLFLLAVQLVVVAVAQLTKLFHVASTFLTVLKFRFLTLLQCTVKSHRLTRTT